MNVRIIKSTELDAPIIWDCFRGSYTHLMCTVSNLMECTVNVEIETVTPEITLCFQMYNTNGFQQSTRKVVGSSIFNSEYSVKDVKDETLAKYFTKFFDDYISNEDSKLSDDVRW
jgi:hypothetical protein